MSDVNASPLPNAAAVKDRAAEWMQRRQFWDWKTEDQNALDAWLAESPAHEIAFIRMERTWTRTERLAALRKPVHGATLRNRLLPIFMRVAVGLAALAIFGVSGFLYGTHATGKEYSTPIGGRQTITLADGSKIYLNTNSALRLDAQNRSAILEHGEAYFEIRHNAKVAFAVTAVGHRVTDLGTIFSVRADSGRLEVSLVGGRARIDDMKQFGSPRTAVLAPGDVAIATSSSLSITHKSQQRLMNSLAWQRGVLLFDDIALAEAVTELGRYSTKKIVIADASVARRTIYGSVPTNDVGAFIRVAHNVMGLHVQSIGDEIVISR
jgi:transmembrane sensor